MPPPPTLKGKRDCAILALLISCGLRHAELVSLELDRIQEREGRWVIPDLVGKGNRLRTVTIPAAVKVRIDTWLAAANSNEGKIFRPVNMGDRVAGKFITETRLDVASQHAIVVPAGLLSCSRLRSSRVLCVLCG